ncbi:hypothetical protein MM300_10430 [Evansella sp. LMS18]|uniref:TIGR04104 family putative zinc finger protein n=1 Tax=Evansella sp. LMS18 TaxID=2924033 RepID=UPI0020D13179|nr:TIGR04104 family putative zinc finger protein [Evansella sp. LMS18]UTR12651.1 hypothetical protein MM300_10430 [Evansella sp. LMS18]
MNLPKCWSCGYEFKWAEVLFFFDGKIKCPACREKQFLTTQSRWRTGVLSSIVIGVPSFPIIFIFNTPLSVFLPALIILLFINLAVQPAVLEFTDTKQPVV